MDKIKPFEVISSQFKVSRETAKHFLGRVQKSFKKNKPPQQMIIDFMNGKRFAVLPKPYHVAKMMFDAGLWVYPMYAEPVDPADDDDIYFRPQSRKGGS